jgi:hypothetical protein
MCIGVFSFSMMRKELSRKVSRSYAYLAIAGLLEDGSGQLTGSSYSRTGRA